jgi:N6-adenosine-specific RNA methylase IME4/ParB-like chromosome segregation protein Spo0J
VAKQILSTDSQNDLAPSLPIDSIIVGERHRRDLGDIAALAESIAEVGLLQPIAVTFDGHLIAGERRLRAVEMLGWKTIPYTPIPINLDQIVRGEFAENTCRKDFTLSEAVAIKRALEPLERARAKERMLSGKPSEKFSEGAKGNALDKVAVVVGKHRTTIAKAEAVVDAAEAEPERFGKLLADMDRTGRVNGVFRRLKIAKQAEAIRAEPPPLPGNGPYRVIVVDVPWPNKNRSDDPSRRTVDYPTMTVAEICALPIASIMHADCVVWFWTTNFYMREAFEALDGYGLERKTILTWAKPRHSGLGDWLFGQTEHAILAVRGKPVVTLTNQTTLLHAPVRGHSVKPKEFYDLVESLCPAPRYADLFSRYRHNDKWDCHGDEIPALANVESPR